MITLETADSALKTVYLGVIGNQLNTASNPLLTKIKQTTNNVYGNEIVKSTSYGISGGVSAGAETDALPRPYGKKYVQFKSTLKNLYGTIEISDKAIRCSQNSAGAFVNLLNEEMESLIKSSSFNLGRMLYGDGTGILGTVTGSTEFGDENFAMDSVKNFAPNLTCRMVDKSANRYIDGSAVFNVKGVDRANKKIYTNYVAEEDIKGYRLATMNGLNNEITGLGAIFGNSTTLYGIKRSENAWLNPYKKESVGTLTETEMQRAIDEIEETSGAQVDFIACSAPVRRAYQECVSTYRRNVDVVDLQGGFKAISYNGIPLVTDRFVNDDEMYLLTSKDFELCQLGDWQWLEGNDGKVIKQKDNYPVFTATLVKYAELICNRPNSQAKLSGIVGA